MSTKMNPVDRRVGDRARKIRSFRGLSISQVAQELKMSSLQLEEHEEGARRFAACDLLRLTRVLNVSGDFFFQDRNKVFGGMDSFIAASDNVISMRSFIESRQPSGA